MERRKDRLPHLLKIVREVPLSKCGRVVETEVGVVETEVGVVDDGMI